MTQEYILCDLKFLETPLFSDIKFFNSEQPFLDLSVTVGNGSIVHNTKEALRQKTT